MKNGWMENWFGALNHYINDDLHCEDGPAVKLENGDLIWFYEGKAIGYSCVGYTQKDFEAFLKFKVFL